MTHAADAIVVGAGIVGASCAHALAAAGLRVTVVEPHVVGGGATAAGMGHIVVMDDSPAQFALTQYSRRLWLDLARELPARAEYDPCGTLWVAADEEEMRAVHTKHSFYREHGLAASILDARQLAEAEPNLRSGMTGALLVHDDCVLYSPAAAMWLLRRVPGVTVLTGRATALRPGTVSLDDGSTLSAGAIVCASGIAAVGFFPWLPVRPRKGHLAITDRYPGFVRHQLVELGYLKSAHGHSTESVAFNVQPRTTGQVLIGSSRQYGVTATDVEPHMIERMIARACEYMPSLARLSVIRTWTGFRAATEDSLPVIGACPDVPGVWLATGHEGLGITTSLATGALIADSILARTPAIDASPYAPARFGGIHA
jgi:glycine/D-amino acid oxidase-like deaminating enzyme